ncbi:MAG: ABC transporter permease [Desulfovibrio sp.]|jgi:putative ABC transport system permease protein|nr:ABC transporter permease [Desulfovibrio sp.]
MLYAMIRGALFRQRSKLVMIACTIALGVSLATAMLNVMFDVGDKVNQELKTYGANLNVVPKGVSLLGEIYSLDPADMSGERPEQFLSEADLGKIKMIFWAYNIVAFAPYLETGVRAGDLPVTLVGTWFAKHLVLPTGDEVDTGIRSLKSWWDVRGEFCRDDTPRQVMLGNRLAARLGLNIGDSLSLRKEDGTDQGSVTVIGIYHSGSAEDDHIVAPLALAQEIAGRPGQVQRVEVSALTTPENDLARRAAQDPGSLSRMEWDTWYCTAYISSIAYQLEEILPGARVKPVLHVAESEGAILEKTQLLMLLLTLLSLICSALAISNLVTATVMERSTEIGLLKALGATNLSIILLLLAEILLTALFGAIAGYCVGLGFAQIIGHTVFGAGVAAKGLVIPLVAVLVLIVTLIGSLPATRLLLLLQPTEVLHGK